MYSRLAKTAPGLFALATMLMLPARAQDLPPEVIAWPDTIYTNAIIVTLDVHELNDDPGTIGEAMAVRDGVIQAVGPADYIMRMRGPDTEVMDLAGKMVVPGFIESHTHPFALFDANLPEPELALPHVSMGVQVEATPEATYAKITRYAKEAGVRPGEWVLIELIPNPPAGVPTIWDIAEGWIGTPTRAEQSFTREGLTAALPDNPANAGIRNVREPDGLVRRHRSVDDVEILRQAAEPVANAYQYDTEAADRLAHWRRYNEGLVGSHAYIVFNDLGWQKTAQLMPGLAETVTALRPDVEDAGTRAILGTGEKKAWTEQVLKKPYPTPVYAEAVKRAFTYMARSGITAFGSRVDFPHQLSAYHYLLRKDGRLPIRHAYTYEMHRNQLHTPYFVEHVYPFMGAHWANGPTSGNPWLWNHGIGSEGAWDTPEIACLGPDLPGLPDMAEEAKKRERCDFLENRTPEVIGMHNALMAGWRIAGLHGVGSHGMRLFIQYVEEAIASGRITEEEVREMRILMAHGTMVGKQPDVIAGLKRYNIIIPFQILRALTDEPPVIDTFYGPEGYEFLAPVKTMIDAGVRVAVETHSAGPPDLLFRHMPALVTRTAAGRTSTPEEGVDRVVALKMFTISNSESMLAEDYIGSLEPGKFADFAVLLNNWLEGPDSELGVNKVIMTVVGDEIIYEDPNAPWKTTAAAASN
ncbi:MAG: amidohydrolase family protein [Woeseiaceae bacterium]|nr:amidohydrolase family protein [Woeseiaceae bacterium]